MISDDRMRIDGLIQCFERASKQATHIIDPPFDCVAVNLRPDSWAFLAEVLSRAVSESTQPSASPSPTGGDVKVAALFAAIEHGDEQHRAWLKEAIRAHFKGEPVPKPYGNGTNPSSVRIQHLEEALQIAGDRFADLGEVIREHGHYDNAGFMDASARRCRDAILNKTEREDASGGTKEPDTTLIRGCSRCGSPESDHGPANDKTSVCKGFIPPNNDGWIPWEGGVCPVAFDTILEVKFRGGAISSGPDQANAWYWKHHSDGPLDSDIIAYRLASPSPPAAKEETDPLDSPVTYRGLIEAFTSFAAEQASHNNAFAQLAGTTFKWLADHIRKGASNA